MKIIGLMLLTLGFSATTFAGEFGCERCICGGHCILQVKQITKTESCFDVEHKEICIPAVRFPWECGPRRPGRTRVVSKLTTEEREKTSCDYEWVPVCDRCGRPMNKQDPEAAPKIPPAPPTPTPAKPPKTAATSPWKILPAGFLE